MASKVVGCVVCGGSLLRELTYRCTLCGCVGHQRCGLLEVEHAHRGHCPACRSKRDEAAEAVNNTLITLTFLGLVLFVVLIFLLKNIK